MPLYGYARLSTLDQDLSIRCAALNAAGCDVIRGEKVSGTRRDGRSELQLLLDFLRTGDKLVVTRIDRLARSLKDLQRHLYELKGKGVCKGHQLSIDAAKVLRLRRDEKLGPALIAQRLGIGRAKVYRLLGKQAGNGGGNADQA